MFPKREDWNAAQRQWIRDYFFRELLPVLTPIGLDPAHPFPRVFNKSLNFAVELDGPDAFGRNSRRRHRAGAARAAARDPAAAGDRRRRRVRLRVPVLDPARARGRAVRRHERARAATSSASRATATCSSTRRRSRTCAPRCRASCSQRHFGDAVRLEVADNCSQRMVEFLLQQFSLRDADLYRVDGPVNLYRLREVPDQVDAPGPQVPAVPARAAAGARRAATCSRC